MTAPKWIFVTLLILTILAMSCAPGSESQAKHNPAGFFTGIWHGWIAPLSLIIGFFNHDIRVYEVHNTGWWYDFGFYIAVISGFGGLSLTRKKKKKDD